LFLTAFGAAGQVPQPLQLDAGIELAVNPKTIAPGMTVTISGSGISSRAG
jgi:hypothetical protein